jgi:hypothetical protein
MCAGGAIVVSEHARRTVCRCFAGILPTGRFYGGALARRSLSILMSRRGGGSDNRARIIFQTLLTLLVGMSPIMAHI